MYLIKNDLKVPELKTRFPDLIESFITTDALKQKRKVNVFAEEDNWISIKEIKEKFSSGIDARSMAWIFNRGLATLGVLHGLGIRHVAINPSNFFIDTQNHNIKITNFCFASSGENLSLIDIRYKNLYPPEIFQKLVFFSTDLYMLTDLVQNITKEIPDKIRVFFRSLKILNPNRRPNDCFEVLDNFKNILKELYGEPKWFEFDKNVS